MNIGLSISTDKGYFSGSRNGTAFFREEAVDWGSAKCYYVQVNFISMESITITATKRTVVGKAVGKLRKAGKLPAVVYGHNTPTTSLEIDEREFAKILKKAGESTLVSLQIEGQARPVLIHDVHNHYLTDKPQHVDFFAVNMNEKVTTKIALHIIGESPAVKNLGGVLVKNVSEIEVECLPGDLPPHFEVDISILKNFEDAIRIKDIRISDKVEVKANPEEVVVAVTEPRSEAEMAELEQKPVDADVTAVEGVVKPTDTVAGEADDKSAKGGSTTGGKEKKEKSE